MDGAARWRDGLRLDGWPGRAAVALVAAAGLVLAWRIAAGLWAPIGSGNMAFSDAFAHWSYARFAAAHPGPAIYDRAAMAAFQQGLFDGVRQSLPFAYPPPYLFLVLPLAAFGLWQAALLWGAVSVAAFVVAVCAGRWRSLPVLLAVLAPATVLCLGYGQNGLLVAAMLAGGMRLLPARPGWGGVLLAMACVKPQLALLLPVALLAGRQWRAIGAAGATGLALVLGSAAWLGPQAWLEWIGSTREQGAFAAAWIGAFRQPTVTATLAMLGAGRTGALMVQAVVAGVVALGVAWAWRRGPSAAAAGAVLAGALLATPYGFVYDLPVALAAVIGLAAGRARLAWPEAAAMGAALLLPAVLHLTSRFFWTGPVVLMALFVVCLWQAGKSSSCEQKEAKNFTRSLNE